MLQVVWPWTDAETNQWGHVTPLMAMGNLGFGRVSLGGPSRNRKHQLQIAELAQRPAASGTRLPARPPPNRHRPSRRDAVTAQRPQRCVPLTARLRPWPVGPALSQSHSNPVRHHRDAGTLSSPTSPSPTSPSAQLLCIADAAASRTEPAAGSPSPRRPGTEDRSVAPSGPASQTVDRSGAPSGLRPRVAKSSAPFGLADHRPVPPPSRPQIEDEMISG
ncbi:hypothetical protein Taro_024096 [Colocasia esculenta]|uniref:Uncharacterized protein n=1 Tax=Colocasia esculenta TaxID=4460 RepID=A0A843V8C8_COLES|nr:hypothetical protein [Colocasia esculenta]